MRCACGTIEIRAAARRTPSVSFADSSLREGAKDALRREGRAVDDRPYGGGGSFMGNDKPFCKTACASSGGVGVPRPTALHESRCGIRGAMHPQGVCRIRKAPSSPTAALWASRPTQNLSLSATSIPSCVGRAHLSPPLLAFSYSRTPIRKLRRGRCPHRPVLASSILLQTTSKRALRRGGTPSVTASPCRLPQGGRQGRCCAGAGGR